jgi:hypothetical protein
LDGSSAAATFEGADKVMVGRRTTHERKGAQAARADEHRILFAAVAVSIFALSAASAEAQQSPTLPSLPAGGESVVPSESLPDIARVPGGWTADAVETAAGDTDMEPIADG